jgi:hypothetical protein
MAALRRSCLVLGVLASAGCEGHAPSAPAHAPVSLRIDLRFQSVPRDPYLEIQASYLKGNTIVPLPVSPRYVAITFGTTVRQALTLDILPCITDAARTRARAGECDLTLVFLIRNAGDLVFSTSHTATGVRPGAQVTVPPMVFGGGINTTKP